MLDPAGTIINAVLLCAALLCAYCAPRGRDIRVAAWLVALNWSLWVLSYVPIIAPAYWLAIIGIHAEPEFIWAMTDALCAGAIFAIGWDDRRGWSIALWALYVTQCGFHIAYNQGVIEWAAYSRWLDIGFWGQIAVFLLLGGRNTLQRVGDEARQLAVRLDVSRQGGSNE